ncbi:MAG: universal stress protein [Gammaproteobacteria bacterium]
MRPIRTILVAIKDPMARSLPAVEKAAQLARAFGARLELFHALADPVYVDPALPGMRPEEIRHHQRERFNARLNAVAARLRKKKVRVATSTAWDYPPHEAIIRQAARAKADLIIAECHAGRRIAPLLLHLTDWELLKYSPVPVLLIKSRKRYERPVLLAAVDPTHANAKPTQLDDEILEAAVAMRRALHGSLHVVHAFVPVPTDVTPAELLDEHATEKLEARARSKARARLDAALGKMRLGRGNRHLASEHPLHAIPRLVRKIHSDIVVMGAVSRSGLRRLLIGNTAERIVDDLTCDVLVVKPREFADRVKAQRRGMRFVTAPMPLPY